MEKALNNFKLTKRENLEFKSGQYILISSNNPDLEDCKDLIEVYHFRKKILKFRLCCGGFKSKREVHIYNGTSHNIKERINTHINCNGAICINKWHNKCKHKLIFVNYNDDGDQLFQELWINFCLHNYFNVNKKYIHTIRGAYLVDFKQKNYQEKLCIDFLKKLYINKDFYNLESLKKYFNKIIKNTRFLFNNYNKNHLLLHNEFIRIINFLNDNCFICSKSGHFAAKCSNPNRNIKNESESSLSVIIPHNEIKNCEDCNDKNIYIEYLGKKFVERNRTSININNKNKELLKTHQEDLFKINKLENKVKKLENKVKKLENKKKIEKI